MNKKTRCQRSRRWCFTLNNWTEEECDKLSGLDCEYLIYGFENAPSTGTPHLQGYVVFKNARSFNSLHNFNERIHWEEARFDHEFCINYCSKNDPNPYEKGVRPITKHTKIDIKKELKADLINGPKKLATKRAILGIQLEQEMFKQILHDTLEKPSIVYVYGRSGTGKTYFALKDGLTNYGIKNCSTIKFDKNGFAHCNNPQAECLIWMEFRPSCLAATDFLELIDGYGCSLNIKHGSIFIRPKCIYICSILHPKEIYKEEINVQFERRITRFVNKDEDPYQSETEEDEI